jgi:hypothetical protein
MCPPALDTPGGAATMNPEAGVMARWTGNRIARLVAALFGAVGMDGPFPEDAVVRDQDPGRAKAPAPDRPPPPPVGGSGRPTEPGSASIDPQAEDRASRRRA